MKELFFHLLDASFYGSIVILVVMALRLLLKKAPRNAVCTLWILAGLRLILPFEVQTSSSLLPRTQVSGYIREAVQTVQPEQVDLRENLTPIVIPDIHNAPAELASRVMVDYTAVAVWLWVAGIAGMTAYALLSYRKLRCRVKNAAVLEDGCYESGRISNAFVLGFFRPDIYLPEGLPQQYRAHVLAHERAHIARGDHWMKIIAFGVLAIHWFNPLVWVAYHLLCRDIEMACDERVVRDMDVGERKAYSFALLSCSADKQNFGVCPVAFGEVSVGSRILRVLRYRKAGFWISLAAVVAVMAVGVCFLTSPKEPTDDQDTLSSGVRDHVPSDYPTISQEDQARAQTAIDALAAFQKVDTYGVYISSSMEGDLILNSGAWREYWQSGDRYYRFGGLDGVQNEQGEEDSCYSWYLYSGGQLYVKGLVSGVTKWSEEEGIYSVDELRGDLWRKAQPMEGVSLQQLLTPWLRVCDLDAIFAPKNFLSVGEGGLVNYIVPVEELDRAVAAPGTISIALTEDGALDHVILSFIESGTCWVDGEEMTLYSQVTDVYRFFQYDETVINEQIDKKELEALAHNQ